MLGQRELGMDDYVAIWKRHRWLMTLPLLLMPMLGYAVSYALPKRFTSSTLVLIGQPTIPVDIVRPIDTEGLQERISSMLEQVMSRKRLEPLINSFNLYKEDRGKVPMEELVDRIRKAIVIQVVKPTITTKPGTVPGFTVSFTGDSPQQARDMCSQVTSLFIEENLKRRESQAEGTYDFLKKNIEEAEKVLKDKDQALAELKSKYMGMQPEQAQINLNLMMTSGQALEAATQSLNRAQQDKVYVESLLAQAIVAAQPTDNGGSDPLSMERQLAAKKDELTALEGKYTASHPDVVKVRNEADILKKKIADAQAAAKVAKPADQTKTASAAEPPNIQNLRTQIHILQETIQEKTREQARYQEQLKSYRSRVEMSPNVEQQFKDLTRDYTIAQNNHAGLLQKLNEADRARKLESMQQGETFKLYDPANLPERPSFPDRKLFAAGGLGLGMALGLGFTLLLEMRDKCLRSDKDIEFFLELPTLAMVPTVHRTQGAISKGPIKSGLPQEAMPGQRA
ncbi:MAG: hypothetical protein HY046_05545 [Acidobacteria bacterium]|nr:hypothetical protein [Acidobacteriota bacterium]